MREINQSLKLLKKKKKKQKKIKKILKKYQKKRKMYENKPTLDFKLKELIKKTK